MSSSRHISLPTKIVPSALDLVGNTSLVALDRIRPGPERILAKADFMQPGGSVKDRAARAILLAARADGRLALGAPVIEMTSGNMEAGLAVACAALGHPLLATMSAGNSPQRARMLEALGAEVVLVPQIDGLPGQVTGADVIAAAEAAQRIAVERGGFYVNQFHAPASSTPQNVRRRIGRRPAQRYGSSPAGGSTPGLPRLGPAQPSLVSPPRCGSITHPSFARRWSRQGASLLQGFPSPSPVISSRARATAACLRGGTAA